MTTNDVPSYMQLVTRQLLHNFMKKFNSRPRVTIAWSHRNGALCRFFHEELPKRFAR